MPTGAALGLAHEFNLSAPELARGLSHLASATALRPIVARLAAGESISIGLLGASVGQDAGCYEPGRRCNDYSGRVPTGLPWRRQRRPYAGFLVRFMQAINTTWPNAEHQITNGAADGTPPQSILDCLFSHLPRNLDIVILEFGSMARDVHMPSVEALLRVLLGQPRRPLILFLTVREWCRADKIAFGSRARPFGANESTTWSRAEGKFERLCAHYDLSCLSYYRALSEGFHARAPGYGYDDLAADCLHPLSGRRGTEVMTDLLAHWLDASIARVATDATAAPPRPPPLPLERVFDVTAVDKAQASARHAACYSMLEGGSSYQKSNHLVYQRLRPNPWVTAYCARRPGHSRLDATLSGCSSYNRNVRCTPDVVRPPSPNNQPVWFYCFKAFRADGTLGKKSPGVLALHPGATLDLRVDTRLHDSFNAHGGVGGGATNASAAVLTAKLLYLRSYNGMGRIELSCHFGCACATHTLDAHRVSLTDRNISVYDDHTFDVHGASASCVLRARIVRGTSSGGHKFKLRFLTVTASDSPGASAPQKAPKKKKPPPPLRPGDHEEVLP